MKVYLAITSTRDIGDLIPGSDILIAYPYIRRDNEMIRLIPKMRNFILDSGVFTMINSGKRFDLEKYVEEYAAFIREHSIRQYVELDVDQIAGVRETRELRRRLESLVGWKSIPVWHTIRGKEAFIQDCKDYDYICLGYFLTEGFKSSLTDRYAKAFINTAHKYNCRIHGLGYTKSANLKKLGFDSVDSSTWAASHRFGSTYKFNANEGTIKATNLRQGRRMKNSTAMGRPAFIEWKKYQNYAYSQINPVWE